MGKFTRQTISVVSMREFSSRNFFEAMHKTRSLIWPLRRPQGVTIDVVSITYLRNPRIAHSRESPPAGDTFVRCLQRV